VLLTGAELIRQSTACPLAPDQSCIRGTNACTLALYAKAIFPSERFPITLNQSA
jgi:hypothetical protein